MKRWFKWFLAVCLLAAATQSAFSQVPETLTAEQKRQLEEMTSEQRKALSRVFDKQQQAEVKEQAPEQPVLVAPLSAPDGPPEQEPVAGRDETKAQDKSLRGRSPDEQLLRFGYDLFAGAPTTFAPATDIPITADYVIGPGDTVQIQLFGKEPAKYSLVVTREGALQFPEIGPVSVAGLTFPEMKRMLEARIEEQMIGRKVTINMGALRSIRVFILGDANRPGSYTVSALSTMTNALFVSGGVKPIGSLRDIQLKRQGKVVGRLDLYDLLLRGDTSGDARLQPGDVIFIPPVGASVGVAGEVRRPAIYELRKERTVEQVVALAGGLLPTAYPQATQIERINARGERTLVDLDISKSAGQQAKVVQGDVLRVYSVLEKMEDIVLLTGHVQRPGGYQWRKGMRVADLIPSIENDLLPRPDLDYALLRRELRPDHRVEAFSVRLGEALQHPAIGRQR